MGRDFSLRLEDLVYASKHGLLNDEVGQQITQIEMLGVGDSFTTDFVHQRVQQHKTHRAFGPPFDDPPENGGDMLLGTQISSNKPVHCPIDVFGEPMLTLGSTGCGKTTKSLLWNAAIAPQVRGQWIFDFRKSGLRILRSILMRLDINLHVCRARDLRLNPLQVPCAVDPRDYAANVAQMLVQVLELPPRATKLLNSTIVRLYCDRGILDGGKNFPTLFDVGSAVEADAKANPQAKNAIVDSLEPVLLSLGEVLNYNVGWTTRDLATRHILFELGGVSDADKNLILNTLVLGEFLSRVAQGIDNQRVTLFISCDEAARMLGTADNCISDLICVVRGTGIGLDLSLQSAQVSKSVLSNTPSKFIGRVTSYSDLDAIGSSMGLSQEQRLWIAHHLERGMWVGQLGLGDRRPFVFQTPRLEFREPSSKPDDGSVANRAGYLT